MEQWKDLIYQGKNYGEKLEVSTQGRIRNKINGYIYKLNKDKYGNLRVCISLGKDKSFKCFQITRAVACTFIPNHNNFLEVRNLDGNKENNYVNNIEWYKRTKEDIRCLALMKNYMNFCGTKNGHSTLTQEDINYIRSNYKARDENFGCRALAKKFNIDHSTISRIINKKTYKCK